VSLPIPLIGPPLVLMGREGGGGGGGPICTGSVSG
jgi:hypothetical protein